jgi:hypothetical protein
MNSIDSLSTHDIIGIVKSMAIFIKRPSKERMSSTSFPWRESPLSIEGNIVNDEKESFHVGENTASEDKNDNKLAVDKKHIDNWQQLVPGIQIALSILHVLSICLFLFRTHKSYPHHFSPLISIVLKLLQNERDWFSTIGVRRFGSGLIGIFQRVIDEVVLTNHDIAVYIPTYHERDEYQDNEES